MFRIYTKTFGGKIWRNLHSVSPSNYFGKNLNKGSLEISRQKLCKQHLVQKNENWTPIFLSCLKTLKISFWFFQMKFLNQLNQFLSDFNSLYEMLCSKRKSTMASYGGQQENKINRIFVSYGQLAFNICLCVQSDFLAYSLP